ncbi:unnamed protein product [[Candida] boidinii]|nr:unnamed protein product [[Candida] boidinii]
MIHINYDRIINFLINSNDFLPELFNLYNNTDDTETEIIIDKKRDGIKMIQQFVLVAKKFQPSSRSEFYKSLIDKGLFKMITFAFKDTEIESRILATELIVTIIQHDVLLLSRNLKKNLNPSPIIINSNNKQDNNKQDKDIKKDHDDNKQLESQDDNNDIDIDDNLSLISILSDVVIDEDDIGLKIQSFEALKILLDPDNLLYNEGFEREDDFEFRYNNSTNGNGNSNSNNKFNSNNHDYYMIQFYDKIAKKLFNPLINFEESLSKLKLLTKSEIFKYQKLVELISFISNEHSRDYSRSFILENNLLIGISKLINNLKFPLQLRLSAIRCIKFIILLDDEFYTRYIIKFNLLNSTMEFFNKINNINNLSNSTILNLLYLILENENLINFKLLKNYLINNFYNILNSNNRTQIN